MKRAPFLAGLFLAALPMLALAQADRPGDAEMRAVFQQRYADMKTAMASRDADAIAALLAPGFTSVDSEGATETAEQMIQAVVATPVDANKQSDTTLVSVAIEGDSATVEQRYHMTTTRLPAGAGAPQAIDLVSTSVDTWRQIAGTWLMARTVTRQLDVRVDGKLVVHREQPVPR
jgi:ketosteroid isomerase-like protein